MSRIIEYAVVLFLTFILMSMVPLAIGQRDGYRGASSDSRRCMMVDTDGDGYISYREFYNAMNGKLQDGQIRRIFNAADFNGDGKLSRRELLSAGRIMLQLKTNEMRNRIHRPDYNGDGVLTLREFYSFLKGRLDDNTIKRIFNAADMDGNGELSRREQFQAMRLIRNYIREQAKERIREERASGTSDDGGEERSCDRGRMGNRIRRIIRASDRDGNGRLSYRELMWAHRMIRRALNA